MYTEIFREGMDDLLKVRDGLVNETAVTDNARTCAGLSTPALVLDTHGSGGAGVSTCALSTHRTECVDRSTRAKARLPKDWYERRSSGVGAGNGQTRKKVSSPTIVVTPMQSGNTLSLSSSAVNVVASTRATQASTVNSFGSHVSSSGVTKTQQCSSVTDSLSRYRLPLQAKVNTTNAPSVKSSAQESDRLSQMPIKQTMQFNDPTWSSTDSPRINKRKEESASYDADSVLARNVECVYMAQEQMHVSEGVYTVDDMHSSSSSNVDDTDDDEDEVVARIAVHGIDTVLHSCTENIDGNSSMDDEDVLTPRSPCAVTPTVVDSTIKNGSTSQPLHLLSCGVCHDNTSVAADIEGHVYEKRASLGMVCPHSDSCTDLLSAEVRLSVSYLSSEEQTCASAASNNNDDDTDEQAGRSHPCAAHREENEAEAPTAATSSANTKNAFPGARRLEDDAVPLRIKLAVCTGVLIGMVSTCYLTYAILRTDSMRSARHAVHDGVRRIMAPTNEMFDSFVKNHTPRRQVARSAPAPPKMAQEAKMQVIRSFRNKFIKERMDRLLWQARPAVKQYNHPTSVTPKNAF